jgi:hypothetical protein
MAQVDLSRNTQATDIAAPATLGATERRDPWWIGPTFTALGLGGFVVYATARAFAEEYLSVCQATGEKAWRLPLDAESRDLLKSGVADLKKVFADNLLSILKHDHEFGVI